MRVPLTSQQVRGTKPTAKRQEIRDYGGDNLYLVVQPHTGEKSFVMRLMVDGKQRKKTLGHFPAMSLADAREQAREVKVALRRGDTLPSPLRSPTNATAAPGSGTVSEGWGLYWHHEGSSRRSASEKKRIFQRDVEPQIGSKPLNEVTRSDLAKLISGKFETAKTASNRLHSLLARFFKWCATHGQPLTGLESNPMASVVKMHSERDTARRRYFTQEEIGWWFKALYAAGDYRAVHELLMRSLCRFSDILNLTWGEVVQRENGDWVLEIGRTKNSDPHVAYLHPSALKLLPKRPATAKPEDRVFKVRSRSGKPVERIRAAMQKLAEKEERVVPHWILHDYRRTGTTHLAGMTDDDDNPLVPDHILDRLLGSGLIDHSQKMTAAAMAIADMKVWAQRS